MPSTRWLVPAALAALIGAMTVALAAEDPNLGDFRTLRLGLKADTMSDEGYVDFSCGSNGGPPRTPLESWADFRKCKAEENGLREIYVRYDDRAEYTARAFNDEMQLERYSGTKVAGHPVILSVLFSDAGTVEGMRAVTDPRADIAQRKKSYLLRLRIMGRYGREGWDCVDLPREEGETEVSPGVFIKQRCTKLFNEERWMVVETKLLRKPGQSGQDRYTDMMTEGQFDNSVRFEIFSKRFKTAG